MIVGCDQGGDNGGGYAHAHVPMGIKDLVMALRDESWH